MQISDNRIRKKVQATVNENSADVGSLNDLIGR